MTHSSDSKAILLERPQLLVVRHGTTEWNTRKIYQGRADIPLSEEGREELRQREIPKEYRAWKVYSSPLARAIETAKMLSSQEPEKVSAAVELNFGDWEGQSQDLKKTVTVPVGNEWGWLGLDFAPTGGESYRQAQERMRPWLKEFHRAGKSGVLITHKGIILSLLALAWGWRMDKKPPQKINHKCGHLLEIDETGKPHLVKLNISLEKNLT